ncbi:MAG: aminotransferase [Propionibacterium sp.]|nr:MAG: aminotransferase [Propionibacterium sp.]
MTSLQALQDEYQALVGRGLKLDLTRGKPSSAQLDLSKSMLTNSVPATSPSGVDVRNYGGLTGLKEIREIFAELLSIDPELIIAGGNSSLALMHDTVTYAMLHGVPGVDRPWFGRGVKFICPVPGYDRHFSICEHLGIEMLPVAMDDSGPDMEAVRKLAQDPDVVGMWVVPTYSNPGGVTYDEAVVAELLSMSAAPDFRIWWDNAYALHHLTDDEPRALNVLQIAADAGNPDRVFAFASTSKITIAGGGVSFLGASKTNLDWYTSHAQIRSIGPDKVNHLRHVQHLVDPQGVRKLMREHRQILAPKVQILLDVLQERLADSAATWTHPKGGYFVSLNVAPGTATRVVELAKQAGIALTPAGSAYPYGKDPDDTNIRLAPSLPPEEDLRIAMDGVATCVLLAEAELNS